MIIFQHENLNELSDESINPPATPDNCLAPSLNYIGFRPKIKFDG